MGAAGKRSPAAELPLTYCVPTGGGWDQLHMPWPRLSHTSGLGRAKGPAVGWTESLGKPELAHKMYFAHPYATGRIWVENEAPFPGMN